MEIPDVRHGDKHVLAQYQVGCPDDRHFRLPRTDSLTSLMQGYKSRRTSRINGRASPLQVVKMRYAICEHGSVVAR